MFSYDLETLFMRKDSKQDINFTPNMVALKRRISKINFPKHLTQDSWLYYKNTHIHTQNYKILLSPVSRNVLESDHK